MLTACANKGAIITVYTGHALAHAAPSETAEVVTDYLYNEQLRVIDVRKEWVRVASTFDGYQGWVLMEQLTEAARKNNLEELICTDQETFGYSAPGAMPPLVRISCGTTIEITDLKTGIDLDSGETAKFVKDTHGTWFPSIHFMRIGAMTSLLDIAEKFLGVPYLWGGRTSEGIDCSGLVQISLKVIGIKAPRDTTLQAKRVGRDLGCLPISEWTKGDLLFLPGHVAIYYGNGIAAHADGIAMRVHKEPVDKLIANRNLTKDQLRVRRLDNPS